MTGERGSGGVVVLRILADLAFAVDAPRPRSRGLACGSPFQIDACGFDRTVRCSMKMTSTLPTLLRVRVTRACSLSPPSEAPFITRARALSHCDAYAHPASMQVHCPMIDSVVCAATRNIWQGREQFRDCGWGGGRGDDGPNRRQPGKGTDDPCIVSGAALSRTQKSTTWVARQPSSDRERSIPPVKTLYIFML